MRRTGLCYRFTSVVLSATLFCTAVMVFMIMSAYEDNPTEHYPGSRFEIGMQPLISKKSIIKLPYYWLPFPKGPGFRTEDQDFVQAFMHVYRNGDSGFRNVRWEEPVCRAQSTETNHTEIFYNALQLDSFTKAVQDGYRIQMMVDGVRVVSPHPDGSWWHGFEIGRVIGQHVLLYNHLHLTIKVDGAGRVVLAVAFPRHTESLKLCGDSSDVPNHRLSPVQWSYETHVLVTSDSYRDRNKIVNKLLNSTEDEIMYIMFGVTLLVMLAVSGALVLFLVMVCRKHQYDMDYMRTIFTKVNPPEPAPVDIELEIVEQVSPASAGLTRRNRDEEAVDVTINDIEREHRSAKHLLTYHHATILGRPSNPRILATLVAAGIQFVFVFIVSLVVSLLYQHSWNNAYQTITIVLLPLTGAISGLMYTRLKMRWTNSMVFRGDRYQTLEQGSEPATSSPCCGWDHVAVIIVVTLPLYLVYFVITSMGILYPSPGLIVATLFLLGGFIVVNGIMYASGINLAHAFPPATRPYFVQDLPNPLESSMTKLALNMIICATVAGVQGFGAVFIGDMFLSTPWNTKIKLEMGFVILFLVVWLIGGAMLSALATYGSVIYVHQPRWHWLPYFIGLTKGLAVFVFGVVASMDRTTYNDEWMYVADISLLAVASFLVGIGCGAVDWLATYLFWEWAIYGNIVIKD